LDDQTHERDLGFGDDAARLREAVVTTVSSTVAVIATDGRRTLARGAAASRGVSSTTDKVAVASVTLAE
jgi:hypothetical protein